MLPSPPDWLRATLIGRQDSNRDLCEESH